MGRTSCFRIATLAVTAALLISAEISGLASGPHRFEASRSQPSIKVGQNVQVSIARSSDPHFETLIAADPSHANRLAVCSMIWPTSSESNEVVTYVSFDRGLTWKPSLFSDKADYRSWDPACTYGSDGSLFVLWANLSRGNSAYDLLTRSPDGGQTWEAPSQLAHIERSYIAIDKAGGASDGWIYLHGTGTTCVTGSHCTNLRPNLNYVPNATSLRFSQDGGRTFLTQLVPTDVGHFMLGYGAGPGTVLSDGTFIAPIGEWKTPNEGNDIPPAKNLPNVILKVMRVIEGRRNWPLTVDVVPVGEIFMSLQRNGSAIAYLTADASNGPFRDRVYLSWPDTRSGHFQIMFAVSTDKGRTWSRPRVLDEHASDQCRNRAPDDIHGPIAVNPQGVVGVMWFDRCDHPDNLGWTVRMRASLDGGETFLPSVDISSVPYDPDKTEPIPLFENNRAFFEAAGDVTTKLGVHEFQFSGGDTVGLVSDAAGAFHPVWIGNETGVPQLWTATVTVDGDVTKNGLKDLAGLRDISHDVKLAYTNRFFFRKTGILDVELRVENVGTHALKGPLKIRVLRLTSKLGRVGIVNADEEGNTEGAVWDITLPQRGLLPHEKTSAKHLRFHIDASRGSPPPNDLEFVTSVLEFDTQVLASAVPESPEL